jgi:hypothetical protein
MNHAHRCLVVAAVAALACVAGAASAKGPDDYARRWPVSADGEGAYAITLTPEVYGQVRNPDLSDLAAFNADGAPLAFGPLPPALVRQPPRWREARWFALPVASSMPARDLHIHATRNAAGELSFDATVVGQSISETRPDLLIDVQPGREAIDQLDLDFIPGDTAINAQLVVETSDDLQRWKTLVDSATVARLVQGGQVLERSLVELPATDAAFLRLRPIDPTTALPLQSVTVRLQPAAPAQRTAPEQWLSAKFVRREGRAFFYVLPLRVPAQRLDIALPEDNAVDRFVVSSRDGPPPGRHDNWNPRGELTAFRMRGAGVTLDNEPLSFGLSRDREWRLQSNTDLAEPPELRFAYTPETWLLLTHGKAPYSLVAGSAQARRPDFPLPTLYSQVQARYGADWEPPAAILGVMANAGGDAALTAPPPDRNRTWVLWTILGVGALAIVLMVLRLMREPPRPADES